MGHDAPGWLIGVPGKTRWRGPVQTLECERVLSMLEDQWLSVDEIAAYLGLRRDTVYVLPWAA